MKKQCSERQKFMKRIVAFFAVALFFSSPRTFASSVFSDSFTDPNGALLGQSAQFGSGVWSLTSSTVNPIQVNNGLVVLVNSRSEERRVGSDWSSDVCSSDLKRRTSRPKRSIWFWCVVTNFIDR